MKQGTKSPWGEDGAIVSKIFISYRREDAAADVTALYQALEREFGADAIFKDVDNVPLGVNWKEQVFQSLSDSAVLLLVVGPQWSATPAIEVEMRAAVERRVSIIPLLVRGATAEGFRAKLPPDLVDLAHLNAAQVDHARWKRDMAPVIAAVRDLLPTRSTADRAADEPTTEHTFALSRSAARRSASSPASGLVVDGEDSQPSSELGRRLLLLSATAAVGAGTVGAALWAAGGGDDPTTEPQGVVAPTVSSTTTDTTASTRSTQLPTTTDTTNELLTTLSTQLARPPTTLRPKTLETVPPTTRQTLLTTVPSTTTSSTPPPKAPTDAELANLFFANHTWEDAIRLSSIWDRPCCYDSKVIAGELIHEGDAAKVENAIRQSDSGNVAFDTWLTSSYDFDDAQAVADAWGYSSAWIGKLMIGLTVRHGDPSSLPV